MSRQQRFRRGVPPEEVAAAARRRLALLEEELVRSGLVPSRPRADPLEEELDPWGPAGHEERFAPAAPELPAQPLPAQPLPEPGRHSHAHRRDSREVSPTRALAGVRELLVDRLPGGWGGRVRLTSAHLAVAALVVGVALAVAAVVALRSAGSGEAVPVSAGGAGARAAPGGSASALVSTAPVPSGTSAGTPPGTPSGTQSGGAPPAGVAGSGAPVVVDVAGKVRRPGVATLPAGSRVVDALERAGGARTGVSLTALNLARPLVDGEQILVGVRPAPGTAASAAGSATSSGGSGASVPGALVNLNTATGEQLDTLPGVGPVTAQKILDWRDQHGGFSSVDELTEVDGIGEKKLADLAPLLTL